MHIFSGQAWRNSIHEALRAEGSQMKGQGGLPMLSRVFWALPAGYDEKPGSSRPACAGGSRGIGFCAPAYDFLRFGILLWRFMTFCSSASFFRFSSIRISWAERFNLSI